MQDATGGTGGPRLGLDPVVADAWHIAIDNELAYVVLSKQILRPGDVEEDELAGRRDVAVFRSVDNGSVNLSAVADAAQKHLVVEIWGQIRDPDRCVKLVRDVSWLVGPQIRISLVVRRDASDKSRDLCMRGGLDWSPDRNSGVGFSKVHKRVMRHPSHVAHI